MISHHPGQRISLEEALSHSYLNSNVDEKAARAELQAAYEHRLVLQDNNLFSEARAKDKMHFDLD